MDADLDTLATALDARTDDLLKSFPEHVPWKIQTKGDANRTAGAWDFRLDQVKGVLVRRRRTSARRYRIGQWLVVWM